MLQFDLPWGDATEVSTQTFADCFMPPLPSELDFDAFIHRLSTRRRLGKQLITRNDRLWGYDRTSPSQMASSRAFIHLKTCADRLAGALPRLDRKFQFTANEFPYVEYTFDSFPNAFFKFCDGSFCQSPRWTSVAVSGIYTQEATTLSMLEVSRLRESLS